MLRSAWSFVVFATACGAARPSPTPPVAPAPDAFPAITGLHVYQDFDHYPDGRVPSHLWGAPGDGYQRNAWKNACNDMVPSLDESWKVDGKASLRFDYRIAACNGKARMGIPSVATGNFFELGDRRTYDGVRFVIKPDGAGRWFDYWILDPPHDIRDTYFVPTGTDPVIVYLPWSVYRSHAHDPWLAAVNEEVWEVGGAEGEGHFRVDEQALYRSARPLPGITVLPAQPLPDPVRVDSGCFRDCGDWRADVGYSTPNVPAKDQVATVEINGADPRGAMLSTVRLHPAAYWLPIANGRYRVDLLFVEPDASAREGQRVFDVRVNGEALARVDVVKEAGGPRRPLVRSTHATVGDGMVSIALSAVHGATMISGVQITREP